MLVNEVHKYDAVKRYQYKGGDSSLIYKYILSPLAGWLVDAFIPSWMAPNVVTLIGLCFSLTALITVLIFNNKLDHNGPTWIPLVHAVCIFIYQTLDNMDGKQARKTKTSSPLGLLFDHGCDAVNSVMNIIAINAIFGAGWNMKIFFMIWFGLVTFFFQTWEEYYIGEMILPIINGPTEGLLLICLCDIMSYVHGYGWWHEPKATFVYNLLDPYKQYIPLNQETLEIFYTRFGLVNGFVLLSTIVTVVTQIYNVCRHAAKSKEYTVANALLNLVPISLIWICSFYYCYNSPLALRDYPYTVVLFVGSVWVDLITHFMEMHICHNSINSITRSNTWLLVVLAGAKMFLSLDEKTEAYLLVALAYMSVHNTCLNVYYLLNNVAIVLNLNLFTIGQREIVADKRKRTKSK